MSLYHKQLLMLESRRSPPVLLFLQVFGTKGNSGSTRASVQKDQGICTEEALGKLEPSILWLMYSSCTFRAERGMSHFNAKRGMTNLNIKRRAWAYLTVWVCTLHYCTWQLVPLGKYELFHKGWGCYHSSIPEPLT